MLHLEADVVDLCFNALEAIIERLHDLNVGQRLRRWVWVVAWARDRRRQHVQAWRRQRERADDCRPSRIDEQFRARSADRAADHVPDDDAVHELSTRDDLGTQPRVDSGPGVMPRVRPRICADAPDDELMGVRGALEDVGIVAIQATLQLDDGRSLQTGAEPGSRGGWRHLRVPS